MVMPVPTQATDVMSLTLMALVNSDGRFPYSKSKIEIFSQNRKKNRNLDFITSLCINFYWRGIHLYSIVITRRHFG